MKRHQHRRQARRRLTKSRNDQFMVTVRQAARRGLAARRVAESKC